MKPAEIKKLCSEINKMFCYPFAEEGLVHARVIMEHGKIVGFELTIGRREVEFDSSCQMVAAGTFVG